MANATAKVPMTTTPWGEDRIYRPRGSVATTYYSGCMLGLDASGNVVHCDNTSGIKFDGINDEMVRTIISTGDVAGAAPDMPVARPFRFTMAIAAAVAGDEGKPVYAAFDNLVAYSTSNSILVGFVDQVLSATLVLITPLYSPLNPVAVSSNVLSFTGGTGVSQIRMADNLADGLSIQEGSNKYLTFTTTDGSEAIVVKKNVVLTDAITLVNSANVTGTSLWAAADKGAFFGATPIVIPANTVDYVTMLTTLGLRSTGGTAAATFPGLVTGLSFLASSPTSGGVGYKTGAGGAVSQATDRTTGVTLSKLTGAITTQATSLAAGASVIFTVTNTTVALGDTVVCSIQSGPTNTSTSAQVVTVAAGSFKVMLVNSHASVADTGAAIINYAVLKGVAA